MSNINKQIVNVADAINSPSALTQEQGEIIFRLISLAIEDKKEITLDFDGIESMISPFLNVAIGKLYGIYSSDTISSYLRINNFPPAKSSTLKIVIENAKKYYANEAEYNSLIKEVIDQ